MPRLTDVQLRAWIKAGEPIAGKSDGDGLTFTLSANGLAAWVLRYRINGRRREMTLGRYPEISLLAARTRARALRAAVDQGIDVAAERQQEKEQRQASENVRALAEDWFAREIEARHKHPAVVRRILDNDILPVLGRH
jgi:hypothetical protein